MLPYIIQHLIVSFEAPVFAPIYFYFSRHFCFVLLWVGLGQKIHFMSLNIDGKLYFIDAQGGYQQSAYQQQPPQSGYPGYPPQSAGGFAPPPSKIHFL